LATQRQTGKGPEDVEGTDEKAVLLRSVAKVVPMGNTRKKSLRVAARTTAGGNGGTGSVAPDRSRNMGLRGRDRTPNPATFNLAASFLASPSKDQA